MNGVICRKGYPFTKDFEWLPDAAANASHNQNDPIVNSSKFSQKGALKQTSISANESDVLIFLYQVLHFGTCIHPKELHSFTENTKRIEEVGRAGRCGMAGEPGWPWLGRHGESEGDPSCVRSGSWACGVSFIRTGSGCNTRRTFMLRRISFFCIGFSRKTHKCQIRN